MKTLAVGVLLMFGIAGTRGDAATVLVSTGFESTLPVEFSGAGTIEGVQSFPFVTFGLSFLRNTAGGNPASATTLAVTNLAAHSSLSLSFVLAVIDSWDGPGNDAFNVTLDGNPIFTSAYSNFDLDLPHSGTLIDSGVFGFGSGSTTTDSAYSIDLTIPHSASTATFQFFASGPDWAGGVDESWAIDNVFLTSEVPEPGSLFLVVSSGLSLIFLARRNPRL